MAYISFKDVVEENGKTVKENNLSHGHSIPLDTLVEVVSPYGDDYKGIRYDDDYEGIRLYVVDHTRDCDGEPLYGLGLKGQRREKGRYASALNQNILHGFGEHELKVIGPKETKE